MADFHNIIENFVISGTTFRDEYLVVTFLNKIEDRHVPGTFCTAFYQNMTLVIEIKALNEVKNVFLYLDHGSLKQKEKRKLHEPNEL